METSMLLREFRLFTAKTFQPGQNSSFPQNFKVAGKNALGIIKNLGDCVILGLILDANFLSYDIQYICINL